MTRRRSLMCMLTTCLALRAEAAETPALVVVLVDTSLTIPNPQEYRAAWDFIMERAVGGDRVIIGLVTGRLGTRQNSSLPEIADRELPRKTWNDNPITYAETLAAARKQLTEDFARALAQPRPERTELLRSVRAAVRYFATEKTRDKVLVILSDMLQDSAEHRFVTIRLSTEFTKTLITKVRSEGMLPDLHRVTVYTAVPGVASPEKADELERFWLTYLSACGARIDHNRYGTLANYRR